MATKEFVIPYRPRAVWADFHNDTSRWKVVVAHRRAGKTVALINHAIRDAFACPHERPRFAYVAPYLSQAKSVAWDYAKTFCAPIPGVTFNEAELRVDLPNGARIRLFGADNYHSLRGMYFDGVILDEFGDMDPRAWTEVIRPALSDRQGWAAFAGTPRGKNAFYDMRNRGLKHQDGWTAWVLKASETGILSADELKDARDSMDGNAYNREYECDFEASVEGAYYADEMAKAEAEKRITRVPIEPTVRVDTWWDLGIDDATAIWFVQDVGKERRIVDYLEVSGEGLPQIAKRLDAKGYRYGRHILPHDAEARELGTGVSRIETLHALGVNNTEVIPAQAVADGINATRLMLSRCWFDAERCERGLEALKQYRREWDGKRQVWRERPLHDWCFTGDTKVLTRNGTYRIQELPNEGEVLTPCGWKPYHSPRITRKAAPLVEVRFTSGHTVRCTPDHLFLTVNGWRSAENLTRGSLIQSTLTPSRSISMAVSTAFGRVKRIWQEAASGFTGLSGNVLLAQSLAGVTSTIETLTPLTTHSITLSASRHQSIYRSLGMSAKRDKRNTSTKLPESVLLTGTGLKKDGSGINAKQSSLKVGQSGSERPGLVSNAKRYFSAWFVQMVMSKSSALTTAKPLTIERVRELPERADVWCLTVPGEEAFSLVNGAVVHNCSHASDAFRYGALSRLPIKSPSALIMPNFGVV